MKNVYLNRSGINEKILAEIKAGLIVITSAGCQRDLMRQPTGRS